MDTMEGLGPEEAAAARRAEREFEEAKEALLRARAASSGRRRGVDRGGGGEGGQRSDADAPSGVMGPKPSHAMRSGFEEEEEDDEAEDGMQARSGGPSSLAAVDRLKQDVERMKSTLRGSDRADRAEETWRERAASDALTDTARDVEGRPPMSKEKARLEEVLAQARAVAEKAAADAAAS